MKIFGIPIPFTKAASARDITTMNQKSMNSVMDYGGWYPIVREPFAGAWQRNMEIRDGTAAAFHADFACKTLIARDIAKLRVKLMQEGDNDIWEEIDSPAFSPVLRKPNDYQSHNQFWEAWMLSKLARGNTYVLKERDNRNIVTALHVLDASRVQPMIADDGSVFYRLSFDYLAQVGTDVVVPAREIIHDRFNCLFHPLVGTPPVFASGLASLQGLNAQKANALLFANSSMPGGIITTPIALSDEQRSRFKAEWENSFSKLNFGRVAVMEGDMKYAPVTITNTEAQMVEVLKWSAEAVCSVYHVPPYKIGVDVLPRGYTNIQSLNVEYYTQAIQSHLEEIEELLDDGLGIGRGMGLGTEFDTDNLLRMDSVTMTTVIKDAVGAGVMAPNEGRARFDLPPVTGGDSPYLQQQNYSLEALAKRDAQADPFGAANGAGNAPASGNTSPADTANPVPSEFPNPQEEPTPAKSINVDRVLNLFARAA